MRHCAPMQDSLTRQTHGGSLCIPFAICTHRYVRNTLLMLGVFLIVLPAALSDGHERTRGQKPDRAGRIRLQGHVQRRRLERQRASRATATSAAPASSARRSRFDLVRRPRPRRRRQRRRHAQRRRPPRGRHRRRQGAPPPRRSPGAGPFAARKVVDQSHGREHGARAREARGSPRASRDAGHYPVKSVMAPIPINIADWVGRTPMVQLTRLLPDAPASSCSPSSRCSTPAARSRTGSAWR